MFERPAPGRSLLPLLDFEIGIHASFHSSAVTLSLTPAKKYRTNTKSSAANGTKAACLASGVIAGFGLTAILTSYALLCCLTFQRGPR